MAPQTNRWAEFWPGAHLEAMAADVDARVRAALAAWNLHDAELLLGGHTALVVATGDRVVKVNPRGHPDEDELRGEAEALARWRATGTAVEVLDQRDDGMTLLFERLDRRPMTRLWRGRRTSRSSAALQRACESDS